MTNPRYSPKLRERAVRMVIDRREDYKSEWAANDIRVMTRQERWGNVR